MASRRLLTSLALGAALANGYRVTSEEIGAESKGGMKLDMSKCNGELPDVAVAKVKLMCEDLKQVFLSISPGIGTQVNGKASMWHCGVQAESADGSVVRRYDLGPDLQWVPFDPLAIKIECTEGDALHGKDKGIVQIPYGPPAGAPVQPQGFGPGQFTFADLQDFIRTTQIVAGRYDAYGGNCQHFSIELYEYLTGTPRCMSGVTPPNQDTGALILASVCMAPVSVLGTIVPFLGFAMQITKADTLLREAAFTWMKKWLTENSRAWQASDGALRRC